jgi:hypothetical protein
MQWNQRRMRINIMRMRNHGCQTRKIVLDGRIVPSDVKAGKAKSIDRNRTTFQRRQYCYLLMGIVIILSISLPYF